MDRERRLHWINFYKRRGLRSLGIWLFGTNFEILRDSLDRDLISLHRELGLLRDKTLMEVDNLYMELTLEKSREFINRITGHIKRKIQELVTFSESLKFPSDALDGLLLKANSVDDFIEIEAEMDIHLQGQAIENIHMIAIFPNEAERLDLEQSCSDIDARFGLKPGEFLRYFPTYSVSFQRQLVEFQVEHLESLSDQIQLYLPPTEEQVRYSHLREVFRRQEEFEGLIKFLRQVDPPVIDDKGVFILGDQKKSAMTAFFHVLKDKGKLISVYPKDLKPLVQDYFQMEISREVLNKSQSKLYYQYKEKFERLIPEN